MTLSQSGEPRYRILYIHATVVPPSLDPAREPFSWLSSRLQGEVLQRVWWRSPGEVVARFGPGSYPSHTIDSFRFHWLLTRKGFGALNRLRVIWFFLATGLRLHREKPFDCIVVYAHLGTGLCGLALKWLTGVPLVLQIATSPQYVYLIDRPIPTLGDRMKHYWSDWCLHRTCLAADRVQLLAPDLLDSYPRLRSVKRSVFHDFAAASQVPDGKPQESSTVLFVGAPWYLKGVDLLVRAFRNLEPDFPEARLQLLGHFPDRAPLDALVGDSPRIEILKARPNPEALKLISEAAILVLPSRCEGMGRVLIEAMSAGIPVVGSRIGGIPHLIQDGENGFLFPSGDAAALEDRLRTLLADPDLRRRMGARGRELAKQQFTEARYAEEFQAMVHAAVQGAR